MPHKILKCNECEKILETGLNIITEGKDKKCKDCGGKIEIVEPEIKDIIKHIEYVNENCKNEKYDEELKKRCNLFKLHEFALPYIPKEFGMNGRPKVLHVGESNYVVGKEYHNPENGEQNVLKGIFGHKWWNEKLEISDLINEQEKMHWDGDYTRYVLDSFGKGYSDYFGNYSIVGKTYFKLFNGMEDCDYKKLLQEKETEFPECYLLLKNKIPTDKLKLLEQLTVRKWYCDNVAFTDFFKMPCVCGGGSFIQALKKEFNIEKFEKNEKEDFINNVNQNSIDALNIVIEVLDPDYILFGSMKGYEIYSDTKMNKKYSELKKNRMIYKLPHASYVNRYKNIKPEYQEAWDKAIKEAFNLGVDLSTKANAK